MHWAALFIYIKRAFFRVFVQLENISLTFSGKVRFLSEAPLNVGCARLRQKSTVRFIAFRVYAKNTPAENIADDDMRCDEGWRYLHSDTCSPFSSNFFPVRFSFSWNDNDNDNGNNSDNALLWFYCRPYIAIFNRKCNLYEIKSYDKLSSYIGTLEWLPAAAVAVAAPFQVERVIGS